MASVSNHSFYRSSTWSPCGHFVAAVSGEHVEIRGALALNLLFTLQSAGVAAEFWDCLTYSPDGHSLACCSETTIIIWDTQTGGVAGEIYCEVAGSGSQLVWSLDGDMIGIISPPVVGTLIVCVYEVASGAMKSFSIAGPTLKRCLWAHGKSFRVMTTTGGGGGLIINIYEVGSTLTKVEQFHVQSHPDFKVFSPATYRISISVVGNQRELLILNIRNSEVLLQESGDHNYVTFSPDGNFVAAFTWNRLPIWRYTSSRYTRWRELQQAPLSLQFSPTSSSILGHAGALLHVLHLDHSPAAPTIESGATTHSVPLDTYPLHNVYIATAHHRESTITITNLHSQNPSPSQIIDTGLKISVIVLTGNVLLVKGSDTVVAWLLTKEGVVGGTFSKRRVDRSNSLWVMPHPDLLDLWFSVKGDIVAVGQHEDPICFYHTKTGEILNLDKAHPGTWHYFNGSRVHGCDHYYHDSYKPHESSKCHWSISKITLQEGWVKDPERKHRLWLHPRWRSSWHYVDWFGQVTTLRLKSSSELVIIKF